MAKKKAVNSIEKLGPGELDGLKARVKEYVERRDALESQIEGCREDLRTLDDEFSEEIDLKTLRQIARIIKIESEIAHKDAADVFREILTDPT